MNITKKKIGIINKEMNLKDTLIVLKKQKNNMKFIITETQYNSIRRRLHYTESTITMINGIKSAMRIYDVCNFDNYKEYELKILEKAANHFIFWSLDGKLPTRAQNDRDYDLAMSGLISIIKSRFESKIQEYWVNERKKCNK